MDETRSDSDLLAYSRSRYNNEKRKRDSLESSILPFVSNAGVERQSTGSSIEQRWIDRINTTYHPPSSFTFEISFHNSNPLGLNLRPHFIPYSSSCKLLGCCVILEVIPALEPYIHPGDILLKLNDASLLGDSSSSSFNFDSTTKLISQTTSPRIIKFMRISGLAYNLLPSPAEVILLAQDANVYAKFSCTPGDPTSHQPVNVQMVSVDSLLPPLLKKLVSGVKVPSEVSTIAQNSGRHLNSIREYEGVFKDKNKYVCIVNTETVEGNRQFYVGKFENEDEALNAYSRAQDDVRRFGYYSAKRVRRQLQTNPVIRSSINQTTASSMTIPSTLGQLLK